VCVLATAPMTESTIPEGTVLLRLETDCMIFSELKCR
jgi:hypothetical protein